MLNSLFSYERSTRPLSSVALSSPKVSSISAFCAFSTLVMSLLLVSSVTGQTTIWTEDFTGETGSSASVLTGDQWTATENTASQSGTMSITSSAFRFTGGSPNVTYTCSWVSDAIDIAGYTDINISYSSSGSGGTSAPTLSMSNGSLSGSTFTPDAGSTTTVLTFSFTVPKNKYRTLDNITLTGTSSCTPYHVVCGYRR
jgi:hypothetical protein